MFRGLKVQVFNNRAEMTEKLQKRYGKADDKQIDLWINAWDNYKLASYHQIPKPTCFRVADPNSASKRESYRITYRLHAVRHFLPYFTAVLPNLKGKTKKEVRDIIKFLQRWKRSLPPGLTIKLEKPIRQHVNLSSPPPPPTMQKIKIYPKHAQLVLPDTIHHGEQLNEEQGLSSSDESEGNFEDFFNQFKDVPLPNMLDRKLPPF